MKKFIAKLHYLTQDLPHISHIEQASMACEAGARWIQYRCLSKTDDELLSDINEIAAVCDDWGVTLIVTNHIHLVGKADIQGFHIEDMDADFVKIREQVGDGITLGGSANTADTLIRIAREGADYAGCGPFSITRTKPNNYPLLGIMGYTEIMQKLEKEGIDIPVLAVGGVDLEHADELMTTGIFGLAISAAINLSDDPTAAYKEFHNKLY